MYFFCFSNKTIQLKRDQVLNEPGSSEFHHTTHYDSQFSNSPPDIMGKSDAPRPRVVCCAIPVAKAAGKVLVVSSRKHQDRWVCECCYPEPCLVFSSSDCGVLALLSLRAVVPKGGWESSDRTLEAAAQREAVEEGPALCSLRNALNPHILSSSFFHFSSCITIALEPMTYSIPKIIQRHVESNLKLN